MRKKDKADRLKVEKHDLLKQIHELGVERGEHDQLRPSSAPSTPGRPSSPLRVGALLSPSRTGASSSVKNHSHLDGLNISAGGVNVGANAAHLSGLPPNSSTEQMYEPWDDRNGDRIQQARSTPALRGTVAGKRTGSANRGPLYRIDDAPRRPGSFAPERQKHQFQSSLRGGGAQRRSPNASFQASERFDADSIHYPFPGRGAG